MAIPILNDPDVLAHRLTPKNQVDVARPYAFHVEPEVTASGRVDDVATIFLTNRECPFRCVMCDLWMNTTDETPPVGAIPGQIEFALSQLPPARHIKLYNSGNFFDRRAIPPADYESIARLCDPFDTVVVENHPRLCTEECVAFRRRLSGRLEIAIGLETARPDVLKRLNKRMTVADYERAVQFLVDNDIDVRSFILLQPAFMDSAAAVNWCVRSVETAFDAGSHCCAIIPTRSGNGAMDLLATEGQFAEPTLAQLESALQLSLELGRGRVWADLWDVERFAACRQCAKRRVARIRKINLAQQLPPAIDCPCQVA